MNAQPIFIMGFMASGKSSLGKKLARQLELEFVDLDDVIEINEGGTISEIFEQRGEDYFRKIESETLMQFQTAEAKVIALGGGTPCNINAISFIKEQGLSIYLKLDADKLIGRLRQNKTDRPLVADKSDEEIASYVREKLAEREPYYKQADIWFDVSGQKMADLVAEVKSRQQA